MTDGRTRAPSDKAPSARDDLAGLVRVVLLQDSRRALIALALLLLAGLAEGGSLLLLTPVLNLLVAKGGRIPVEIPFAPPFSLGLPEVLACLAALVIVQSLLMRAKSIYVADLISAIVNKVRSDLFLAITQARWPVIAKIRISDLEHALTADIDRLSVAAYQILLFLQHCVLLTIYVAVSLVISPAMTGYAALVGLAVLGALRPIRKRASEFGGRLTDSRRFQYQTISEFLNGLKVAKSLSAEARYREEFDNTLSGTRRDYARYIGANTLGDVVFQSASVIALALFVYLGFAQLRLPVAQIVVLAFIFMRIAPRFMILQSCVQDLLLSLPAYAAMRSLKLRCAAEPEAPPSAKPPAPALKEALEFESVSFRYRGETVDVLRHASFSIPAGLVTAIIGPSGSGKSTIADLLLGLLEPSSGVISIDGRPLGEFDLRDWRRQVAYVPQEVFFINRSVRDNFRLAQPAISDAQIWRTLETAEIAGVVRGFPDGLATPLGDRGARLSGGERQRLALARALAQDPRLLILDEATSALDWENQALIAKAIRALRGAITIVTIAHRPSMIAFADWVVALHDGTVAEYGRYADLERSPDSRLRRLLDGEGIQSAAAHPG